MATTTIRTKAKSRNPLRTDPTRTATLRRRFEQELKRRMARLANDVYDLLVTEDAFGLKPRNPFVGNVRFKFLTKAEQVEAFKRWLASQMELHILKSEAQAAEDAYWQRYVEEGYRKGAGRAFDDTRKAQLHDQEGVRDFYNGTKDEFLRSSFGHAVSVEKVKLLAGRVFTELKGVTDAMAVTLTRALTDGLVQGKNPRAIARDIDKAIEGITRKRALVIARTEIIRAHAEGQLDALERLGVAEVGVMVEWSTAHDDRVCELCGHMEGVVMKINEARGAIPRHPSCRCCFMPANVGENTKGQKRGKRAVTDSINKSIQAERPKATLKEAKAKTKWSMADAKIVKERLNSILGKTHEEVKRGERKPRMTAEEKAAAEAAADKAKREAGISLKDLGKRLQDTSKTQVTIMDEVLKQYSQDGGTFAAHGMANKEEFLKVRIEGVDVYYNKDRKYNMASSVVDWATTKTPVSNVLWQQNRSIIFSTQQNKDDPYWEKKYNEPGFKSAATGGDGHVVVYNTRISEGTLAHESGHNLATAKFGSTHPSGKYAEAQKKEPAVSEYGGKAPAEDFAEACKLYTTDRERFKKAFPEKYKALKELIDGSDTGKPKA